MLYTDFEEAVIISTSTLHTCMYLSTYCHAYFLCALYKAFNEPPLNGLLYNTTCTAGEFERQASPSKL